jgi:uncharacterized membrane protein YsdA (DUF1294 family)
VIVLVKKMKNKIRNPYTYYLLTAFILTGLIAIALWKFTSIAPLWIYLFTITLVTFLFYGYDKYQAIHQKNRIPEAVLHILAIAGGSIGALAGQYVFRHKTRKFAFLIIFVIIAAAQAGLIIWWITKK